MSIIALFERIHQRFCIAQKRPRRSVNVFGSLFVIGVRRFVTALMIVHPCLDSRDQVILSGHAEELAARCAIDRRADVRLQPTLNEFPASLVREFKILDHARPEDDAFELGAGLRCRRRVNADRICQGLDGFFQAA